MAPFCVFQVSCCLMQEIEAINLMAQVHLLLVYQKCQKKHLFRFTACFNRSRYLAMQNFYCLQCEYFFTWTFSGIRSTVFPPIVSAPKFSLKFIFSEKATKFCEIFPYFWLYVLYNLFETSEPPKYSNSNSPNLCFCLLKGDKKTFSLVQKIFLDQ